MKRQLRVVAWGLSVALCACTTYRAMPITPQATSAALAIPPPDRLQQAVRSLRHPLLAPVVFDPAAPYTADVVAILAIILNPALRSARDQHAMQAAQVLQAGILPNPQLSLSLAEPFTGDPSETSLGFAYGLSWEFTALIARHSHRQAALDEATSVDLGIAWQEWQTALAAQEAYYRLQGAQERLAIAEVMARRAEQFVSSQHQALLAGWVASSALGDGDAVAHDLRSQALDLSSEVAQQNAALIRLLGLPAGSPLRLSPARWTTRAPALEDDDARIEDRRLDLQALRMAYQSQEQAVHAAVLGQFPKISFQFTHQRDTGDIQSYGPGLTIDLPLFDRNQGVIASETATRQRLYDEYLQRIFESRQDLAEAREACRQDAERIRWSDSRLAGLAERAHGARDALAGGLVTEAVCDAAQTAWDGQRLESVLWRQRLAEARIAFEIVAGRYLPQAAATEAAAAQ